ncbi:putative chromatin remodeler Bromodomain family [Helianthus annuus]|nr:putative chromatin remodeler Bromodomain family [Helianthus annuus]KAJ0624012.1 putative chromatin remodeler Bromodomain family [Helianthus annuus]KAJ0784149.1 putative chromatin remodeler Bromodomain family [Helianthus annuus]
METLDAPVPEVRSESEPALVEELGQNADEIVVKVDELEKRLNEVEQFYSKTNKKQSNASKGSSAGKDNDKDKQLPSFKRRQLDASRREAAAAKRMQDLMRQLSAILRQHIMGHKWAGPFMQPVDVVGLGLHDYYEIIEKPMDFSTIKNKMEAKDGSGYKNVREICADVRLIFKNAMKYNDERNDVHVMAKTLLAKFEEKWLLLLPKVDEEEERRKKEEAEAQLDIQLAQEVSHAKMAKELNTELDVLGKRLEKMRETVLRNCRKMSTEEKKALMTVLTQLSPDDLNKALLIVAENNPSFQATGQEVDLDIDAQSESTLWKLKFFVKDLLQSQGKSPTSIGGNTTTTTVNHNNNQNKRKRETNDAPAKPSQKKNKKPS